MLKKYSLMALQTAINKTLSLDPTRGKKIHELQNKVIELVITPLNVNFFISFDKGELLLLDKFQDKADAVIHSNPLGLIRLSLLPSSKARSLFNDKIRISGDIELGQQIKKLFDEINIDWEGHLAQFTGDVVAYQIGSFVRKGVSFTTHLNESMQHNLTEYLQEECALLPSKYELEDFYNQIDELSLNVERIEAHVKQLLK